MLRMNTAPCLSPTFHRQLKSAFKSEPSHQVRHGLTDLQEIYIRDIMSNEQTMDLPADFIEANDDDFSDEV